MTSSVRPARLRARAEVVLLYPRHRTIKECGVRRKWRPMCRLLQYSQSPICKISRRQHNLPVSLPCLPTLHNLLFKTLHVKVDTPQCTPSVDVEVFILAEAVFKVPMSSPQQLRVLPPHNDIVLPPYRRPRRSRTVRRPLVSQREIPR